MKSYIVFQTNFYYVRGFPIYIKINIYLELNGKNISFYVKKKGENLNP